MSIHRRDPGFNRGTRCHDAFTGTTEPVGYHTDNVHDVRDRALRIRRTYEHIAFNGLVRRHSTGENEPMAVFRVLRVARSLASVVDQPAGHVGKYTEAIGERRR